MKSSTSRTAPHTSDILFECVIPGRVGIKKNNRKARKIGRRIFTAPSDNFEFWAHGASVAIAQSARGMNTINFPVNVSIIVSMPNHHGEPDLSNAYQGVEDLLQEMGVLKNDRLIYSHDGSRKIFGQPFSTRVIIRRFDQGPDSDQQISSDKG